MTHLHVLNELSSTIEHQEQGVPSVQAVPKNLIPRLYEIAFTRQLEVFNQLPLAEREIGIQNTTLPQNIKMRFLQPVIEQKLREAKTYDAILALFQEIKALCSLKNEEQEEAVYNSNLFQSHMKPIIQKEAKERMLLMPLQDFLAKTKGFPDDTALSEMFGLWYGLDIQDRAELSWFVQQQTFITKIHVNTYEMGDEGARALADTLKVNRTLTSLELGYNQGDESTRALVDALKVNRTLTSLKLEHTKIGVEEARALADALKKNGTLTSLNLEHSQIYDEGARELADALKENRTLTSLSLWNNEIRAPGAESLADALKVNGMLTSLELCNNHIGIQGARALANALKQNRTLTSLGLGINQIYDEGARELADALKVNRTLIRLDLVYNDIDSEGARAFADALSENGMLTTLYLQSSRMEDDMEQVLQEMQILYPTRSFYI